MTFIGNMPDARIRETECLRAPAGKTRRAWHAPDGATRANVNHKVGLTRDCRQRLATNLKLPDAVGGLDLAQLRSG